MNIIKLKDILLNETSGLEEREILLFNEKFKGKFVFCINFLYCICMEDVEGEGEVVEMERMQGEESVQGKDYLLLDRIKDYVNIEVTNRVNNYRRFMEMNEFIPDGDLTLEDIKRFRTWVAEELLIFRQEGDREEVEDKELWMLLYYKNHMMDDTIKHLMEFSNTVETGLKKEQSCSCNCMREWKWNLDDIMGGCDVVGIYRKNIYNVMVEKFSRWEYWVDTDVEFLEEMKRRVEGVLKTGLKLSTAEVWDSGLKACGCNDINSSEEYLKDILKNLIRSLQLIINEIKKEGEGVGGNKNFITTSLTNWASLLYEKMEWV